MSTFFQQTVQAMIAKHIDRFPLLKLDQVIDWQPIEQYLNRQRTRYLRDHRGRPAYPLLSMFKAVLLGQWHSLSDPELEHSLITRIDFNLFCRFDELSIPDYSTLCRYRNRRPAQSRGGRAQRRNPRRNPVLRRSARNHQPV